MTRTTIRTPNGYTIEENASNDLAVVLIDIAKRFPNANRIELWPNYIPTKRAAPHSPAASPATK